jgi:hypothetical protein
MRLIKYNILEDTFQTDACTVIQQKFQGTDTVGIDNIEDSLRPLNKY